MATKNLARDGRVPKKLGPIAVNGGMYHFREGALIAGISRTQAQHPVDDEPMIHQPTVEKNLAPVEINPGCRSRRNDPLN
jgi:hypothetical protein